MAYEREKEVSIQAALAAARLCEQVRKDKANEAVKKGDGSPVTVADFLSQAVICRAIGQAFPKDPVVAEEDSRVLQSPAMASQLEQIAAYMQGLDPDATHQLVIDWVERGRGSLGPRYWTVDPIDGTKGFLRGDQYAVALALVERGDVKVGAMACPRLPLRPDDLAGESGVLFVAVRGEGATMSRLGGGRPRPIHVAGPEKNVDLPFVESFESAHSDHQRQNEVAKAVGIKVPSERMDSQVKYATVARGQAVLYLRLPLSDGPKYFEKIWDHAAGTIIVEEAGGRVTDMYSRPLDFSQGPELFNTQGIVASNGAIHERVLEALKRGK